MTVKRHRHPKPSRATIAMYGLVRHPNGLLTITISPKRWYEYHPRKGWRRYTA